MSNINEWEENADFYQLSDGISLIKADNRKYAKYYAIYDRSNISFRTGYEQSISVIDEGDSCFWINKGNKLIGGVMLEQNYMEDMFLIPPFNDAFSVIKAISDAFIQWADKSKEISVFIKKNEYLELYQRIGFRITDSGRWMIRPTEKFDVHWDKAYNIRRPSESDITALGRLFYDAFHSFPGKSFSLEERTGFVKYYFEHNSDKEILLNASSVVCDSSTNELIGVCLISEWNAWPLVFDIAVHEKHQNKGLASNMLKHSLSVLEDKYPAIRLYVEAGNSAEMLYYNLGFLVGPRVTNLIYPV
ncbi:MAG: GNAT family N-acetyltransferase [Bacillota bacterium]